VGKMFKSNYQLGALSFIGLVVFCIKGRTSKNLPSPIQIPTIHDGGFSTESLSMSSFSRKVSIGCQNWLWW